MECIFCSIAEGTAPSWSVYEDEVAVARPCKTKLRTNGAGG